MEPTHQLKETGQICIGNLSHYKVNIKQNWMSRSMTWISAYFISHFFFTKAPINIVLINPIVKLWGSVFEKSFVSTGIHLKWRDIILTMEDVHTIGVEQHHY